MKDSIFKGLIPDPRNVAAPGGSTNAELLALPQQREYGGGMKGKLLLLPRTGLIVVPRSDDFDPYCIVVDGSACRDENGRETYPRGGHDIAVSHLEMTTAIELTAAVAPVDTQSATDYVARVADQVDKFGVSVDWWERG